MWQGLLGALLAFCNTPSAGWVVGEENYSLGLPRITGGYKKVPIITNHHVGLNLLRPGVPAIQGSQWVLPSHRQGSPKDQVQLLWLVQKAAQLTPKRASPSGFPAGFRPT